MKTAFLKNYTSNVPVSQTLYRIEQVLIKCGVKSIEKEYGPNAEVCAVRFRIQLVDRELAVRLPADKEKAQDALWFDYVGDDRLTKDGKLEPWNRKKKKRADFAVQAERTAWRIVKDWVEVQLSMIQLKQADTVEVFMPYVWDGRQTFYNKLKSQNYHALLPQTTS